MPKRLLLAAVLLVAAVVAVALWSDHSEGQARTITVRRSDTPVSTPAIPVRAALSGRVVEYGTGSPVGGATVLAYAFETGRTFRATSAVDGTFDVPEAVDAGRTFQIVVRHRGFGAASLRWVVPGEPLLVRLPEGGAIRGRVTVDDAPVPECRVAALRRDDGNIREQLFRQVLPADLAIDASAVTQADGSFQADSLAPGTYVLLAERSGLAQCNVRDFEVRAGATTAAEIEVVRTAEIPVEVFDEETGEPVDGARFEMEPGIRYWPAYVPLDAEQQGRGHYALRAGFEDGHFPYTYLRVTHDGYARRVLSFSAQEGQGFRLEKGDRFRVALGRGATIAGRVWSGQQVAEGAMIFVRLYDRLIASAATDADGRFEIGGIDVDDGVDVYACTGAQDPIAITRLVLANGERRTLEIGGPQGATIQGRVALGGVPASAASVRLSGASELEGETDEDGTYRFEGLNAGRHKLTISVAASYFGRSADLSPGQRLQLDVDACRTISGTVVDSGTGEPVTAKILGRRPPWTNAPMGGASLAVIARTAGPEHVDYAIFDADKEGRFRLKVPPGVYGLDCRGFPGVIAVDPPLVDVTDAADAECLLRVAWDSFDGRIELDVKDGQTGAPADGCHYQVGWDSGAVQNGRLSLSELDDGLHRIRLWSDRYVSAEVEIRLDQKQPRIDQTVVLARSEAVRVRRIGRDSPGAQAGLRAGDVILSCDGSPTRSIAAYEVAVAAALGPLTLEIERKGERRTATLRAKEPTLEIDNIVLGR